MRFAMKYKVPNSNEAGIPHYLEYISFGRMSMSLQLNPNPDLGVEVGE